MQRPEIHALVNQLLSNFRATQKMMINIESRGVSGPATMFETSAPNGPALADYAVATKRPSANSISTDMATLIPRELT